MTAAGAKKGGGKMPPEAEGHDVRGVAGAKGEARRVRYRTPERTATLTTSELGFKNGFLLRFPVLYAAGDVALLKQPAVAVVGARHASAEGCKRATQIARDLAAAGIVVMSGLAAGVDAAAHRAAIQYRGRTIGVTAMPLDRVYPTEHAELQMEIYTHHLLVTPFPPGQRIYPKDFPDRNRVMARLARATVVIEAGDTSGTLHQVVESIEAGHDVFIPRSVVENRAVTWPARFLGEALVHVLESSSQVISRVLGQP
jgi:DNA processing protein